MIYIVETTKLLKTSFQPKTNLIMRQLVAINVVIILMDFVLLGFEYASLFILETVLKGFIYSVKLKLEFAILGRLVALVGKDAPGSNIDQTRRERSMAFVETRQASKSNGTTLDDIPVSEFVDLTKVNTDYTHASPTSTRSRRHPSVWDDDILTDD